MAERVYAIVGPLDQRSPENDALNNNLGFIVTPEGVILSGGMVVRRSRPLLPSIRKLVTMVL